MSSVRTSPWALTPADARLRTSGCAGVGSDVICSEDEDEDVDVGTEQDQEGGVMHPPMGCAFRLLYLATGRDLPTSNNETTIAISKEAKSAETSNTKQKKDDSDTNRGFKCDGVTTITILLLCLNLLIIIFYAAFSLTPLLNIITDEKDIDIREWIDISLDVKVVAGVALFAALASNVRVLVQTTCCWRATTRPMRSRPMPKRRGNAVRTCINVALFLRGRRSPYVHARSRYNHVCGCCRPYVQPYVRTRA